MNEFNRDIAGLIPENILANGRVELGHIVCKWLQSNPVTAGTKKQCESKTVPQNYYFVVEQITGELLVATTVGGAIVGSEIPRESTGTLASNTAPCQAAFLLELGQNNERWTDEGVPFGNICGKPGFPTPLVTRQVIKPGQKVFAELENLSNVGTSVSVYGFVVLTGRRIYLA